MENNIQKKKIAELEWQKEDIFVRLEPNPTFFVAAFWNEFVNEGLIENWRQIQIFEKKMSIQSSEEGF